MEEKGNITLKTVNSRRKKVLYNVNVNKTLIMDLKNRVVKRTRGLGNKGTRGKEQLYTLFTVMMKIGLWNINTQ